MVPTSPNTRSLLPTASRPQAVHQTGLAVSPEYYLWKYGKSVRPVQRRNGKSIPEDTLCPLCGAPHHYLYDNNGGNGQFQAKSVGRPFTGEVVTSPLRFVCPYCGHLPRPYTGSFSASINASTPGAPSTFTTSPGLIRTICMRITVKTSISCTTSTGNSRWISSAWT